MAENKMIVVFRACCFKQFGMQSCGTWKGYAASMRPLTNRSCNLDVAVRPQTPAGQLRRMLIAACKARGEKIGVQIGKLFVTFTLKLKGKEPADEQLRRQLDVITDALRAAGMPDGEYENGGQAFVLKGVECRLRDGTIAGSVLRLNQAVKNLRDYGGITLAEAIRAASLNAAASAGLAQSKGSLEAGKDADIVLMDTDCQVWQTIVRGVSKYQRIR